MSVFDMKNPDPNIEPFLTCLYDVLRKGTIRSRYEIMKDANASEELQREMQRLTVSLIAAGTMIGLMVGAGVVVIVYELHIKGLI